MDSDGYATWIRDFGDAAVVQTLSVGYRRAEIFAFGAETSAHIDATLIAGWERNRKNANEERRTVFSGPLARSPH